MAKEEEQRVEAVVEDPARVEKTRECLFIGGRVVKIHLLHWCRFYSPSVLGCGPVLGLGFSCRLQLFRFWNTSCPL